MISQILAVTALNLRTIPQRLGSSGVAIVGIAGVVVVLVSVLSIAVGFTAAMRDSGSPTRAIVMRSGADSEMTSGLGGPEVDVIKQAPGMRRDGQTPLASAELYVIIDLPKKSTNTAANVPMRGVDRAALQVRDEATHRRRPDVRVRHQRDRRRARRERPVRRSHRRQRAAIGAEHLEGGRRLRGRRRRGRNRDLVRRARAAGRLSPRQHAIRRCWRGSTRATASTRSATG